VCSCALCYPLYGKILQCLFTEAIRCRCAKEEDLKDARNVTARRTFRVRRANKPKPKKETGASQNSVNTAGANANGGLSRPYSCCVANLEHMH
jgi:hypothetical protein